jgi:Na+/H+-dicarboxylate symporter
VKNSVLLKVCLSLGIAFLAGALTEPDTVFFGVSAPLVYQTIGQLFLNALKLVVLPLVVSSLILGASRMGGGQGVFESLGLKTLFTFFGVSLTSALVGYLFVQLLAPGIGVTFQGIEQAPQVAAGKGGFLPFLYSFFPSNIIDAAAKGQMPGLILFSLLFGYFLGQLEESKKVIVTSFFQGVFDIMLKITHFVMAFLPLGVFGSVAYVISITGFEALSSSLFFLFTVVGALLTFMFGVLSLFLLFRGISPKEHLRLLSPALLTAFSTSSSAVSIPIAMESFKEKGGEIARISQFTLPLGGSLSMSGTALYACITAFFIANVFNIPLGFPSHVAIILLSVLTSAGTAGVPSSCLISTMLVLQIMDFPQEGIALVLAVERFADMFRSTVNIYGNSTSSVLIAGKEQEEVVEVVL